MSFLKFFSTSIFCVFFVTLGYAQPDVDEKGSRLKDQQILDDLIVDGSACVGLDCVNGETFGFSTLVLKENNLRIRFHDTSNSASFPSRDWEIQANETSNGGKNAFMIADIDGGRTPFTIEAGAPSHSLYVEDGGRLGLGTSTPVVDIHVKSGNTPTLRLEQDGSSGFTAQTWDVAGNETNFFVRDASNGSTLPFRIFPGAPSNAISIEASTGDVGIGTTSPDKALHVLRNGNAEIHLEDNSTTKQVFIRTTTVGGEWLIGQTNIEEYRIRNVTDAVNAIIIADGALPITTFAGEIVTPMFSSPSDRRLKKNIKTFDSGLDIVNKMNPVSFDYIKSEDLSLGRNRIGMVAQELQKIAPFLVGTGEYLRVYEGEIKYVLINAIKEQQIQLEEKEGRIQVLEEEVSNLRSLNDELEILRKEIKDLSESINVGDQGNVFIEGNRAALGQNYPNPFENRTVIDYFIPTDRNSAKIQIFSLSGQMLKSVLISETGKGQINLEVTDFPDGNYTYSLLVDGVIKDSKKMILAK